MLLGMWHLLFCKPKKMAYFNLNYDFAPQLESPAEAEEIDRNNLKKFSFLTVNLLVLKFVMKFLPQRQQRKQHRCFFYYSLFSANT